MSESIGPSHMRGSKNDKRTSFRNSQNYSKAWGEGRVLGSVSGSQAIEGYTHEEESLEKNKTKTKQKNPEYFLR